MDDADEDVEEHGDDQFFGKRRAGLVPYQQAGGLEQRIHCEDGDNQATCPVGPPREEKEEDEQGPGFDVGR